MDITDFPVDLMYYKQLKERVKLAIEIDKLEHKISKVPNTRCFPDEI